MPESYTPREFIEKINADNPGPTFDPYGVEGLVTNQEQSPGQDILDRAKAEVAKEKAKTPEGKVAELERQVEAMKQWLIEDGTYSREEVDIIAQQLNVQYNEETQQAEVFGNLRLDILTSADGLTLPTSIGGSLFLESLTSAEHLKLPTSIGGVLNLHSLTSADGLTLPTSIGGRLNLNSLTSAERKQIRAQRPDLAGKIYPKP